MKSNSINKDSLWFILYFMIIPITLSIFFIHGIIPLFHWIPISILFVVIPFIIFLSIIPRMFKTNYFNNSISKYKTAIIIAIIIPTMLQLSANFSTNLRYTSVSPQLLWTNHTGIWGLSDMSVCWWTETPTQNSFAWGNDDDQWNSTEEKTQSHAFLLHNLKPNCTYWYQINTNSRINFSTPDINNFTIGLVSDLHFGSLFRNELSDSMINSINTDLFFSLGDFVDLGFFDYQWKRGLNFMSTITSSTPTRYVLGNHDALCDGIELYKEYCFPQEITEQMDTYGVVNIGNIHIFTLHLEWDLSDYIGEQQEWFESALNSTNPDDLIIVLSHSSILSSTYNIYRENYFKFENLDGYFENLFEANGVDLVFSGHDHKMERLEKNGVNYNIIGIGGGVSVDESASNDFLIWSGNSNVGFSQININEKNVDVNFIDESMNILNSYSIIF